MSTEAIVTRTQRRSTVLHRLARRPSVVAALGTLAILLVVCLLAPWIAPYGFEDLAPTRAFEGPSLEHLLGTDELGRDVLTRLMYGGRVAFLIIAAATALTIVVGVIWGAVAAMSRGWIDDVLMRTGDVTLAIPAILLALIVIAAFGASTTTLIISLGLIYAPSTARVVRAAVSVERGQEYRLAAVAMGRTPLKILVVEILPNVVPVILAQASLTAALVLLSEAALSFVGLGIQPPEASWGTLLQSGYAISSNSALYVVAPAFLIGVTVLCLNTIGDNLQDVLEPGSETAS